MVCCATGQTHDCNWARAEIQKRDQLSGPPLFLVPGDLAEQMEELCEELDICMALDPDSKIAVYRSKNTVAELVSDLAHFMSSKG